MSTPRMIDCHLIATFYKHELSTNTVVGYYKIEQKVEYRFDLMRRLKERRVRVDRLIEEGGSGK